MHRLVFAFSSLFGFSLSAQFLTTITPVAVASMAQGAPTVFSGVPANHAVYFLQLTTAPTGIDGASLGITTPSGPNGGTVRIDTTVFLLGALPIPRSAGTSPSTSAAGATFGAVEFLMRLFGQPGTVGHFTLDAAESTASSAGAGTLVNQATIDVHADGTIEATSPSGPVNIPVVFPASGLVSLRLSIANHAASTGFVYSTSSVSVSLTLYPPSQCTITSFGNGCGGATSSGTEQTVGTSRVVTLLGAGGFPNALCVSAFGTQNSGPTLPGGCALLTDATILVPMLADGLGAASHVVTMPVSALGTLYHQFVPLDLATFTFRASNGLEILCTP